MIWPIFTFFKIHFNEQSCLSCLDKLDTLFGHVGWIISTDRRNKVMCFINLFSTYQMFFSSFEFFFRGLKMVTITRLAHIKDRSKQLVYIFEKPNLKVSDKFLVKSTVLRECKHHLWEIVTEWCCSALSSFTKSVIYSHTDINTAIMKLKKPNYFG